MEPPAQPVLCLPGPENWYNFGDGGFTVCDTPVRIHQEGGQGRGTGWSVWDGSVVMARHIEAMHKNAVPLPAGCTLELGSGTGLAGLAAATCLKKRAILTDIPAVVPSLKRNRDLNIGTPAAAAKVQPLDWTRIIDDLPGVRALLPEGDNYPALVLAADCVWVEELLQPFMDALDAVCGPETLAVLAYKSRSLRVDALLMHMLSIVFSVQPAPLLPGETARGSIQIVHLTRLPAPDCS